PAGGAASVDADDTPSVAGVRVLAVDDEANVREFVTAVLTRWDADVTVAGSAREALEVGERTRADALIVDAAMPEEDGYQLMRQIRLREGDIRRRTPALALTALVSDGDRERALDAGFDLHLAKPIEPTQLVRAVAALVRGR